MASHGILTLWSGLMLVVVLVSRPIGAIQQQQETVVAHEAETSIAGEEFQHHNRCEPITIPFCTGIQYNRTIMPNLVGHTKQEEAALEVHQFVPLVKIDCSPDLKFFLCLLYAPVCTILTYPIPPCRSLCESARACESIMRTFDFQWPENFECSKFPVDGGKELCVSKNNSTETTPIPTSATMHTTKTVAPAYAPPHRKSSPSAGSGVSGSVGSVLGGGLLGTHRDLGFICPVQLKAPTLMGYQLTIGGKVTKDCGAPCNSMFFSENERTVLKYWVGSWAAVCVASCLFTVLTFLIDSSRFRYPERPIVFLAICYLIVGCAYVAGLGAGDSVACREPFQSHIKIGRMQMLSTITQGHRQSTSCTVLFMALYFCCMAAFAWWACLALAWFLAAGLKWGHEAIENRSHLFHLVAWAIPAVQTIFVLALGKVEGDVLSGVCFVGQLDTHSLAMFLLIPLVIYLSIGGIFLLAGFVSLFRIRTVMKHDGTRTDKLERLMLRIGFFSGLFILPSLGYLACLFYEYYNFDDWMIQWNRQMCKIFSIPCPAARHPAGAEDDKPIFHIYMVKYVCSMLVGVTSSVWLWSGKTVVSWRQFAERLQGKDTRSRGAYV
ncbi:frizzled [Anopheles ziemanni]|uniref:frizzled n=1 Tax=Anopheles coustani TaxID=139045 RepID=UPI00265B565D|nr:frizzled [Anopheles coustani]XP_058170206.1 frizzled [Anopheles ziemanni]